MLFLNSVSLIHNSAKLRNFYYFSLLTFFATPSNKTARNNTHNNSYVILLRPIRNDISILYADIMEFLLVVGVA